LDRLRDPADGAFFFSASREGRPLETDKHLYAQAFAIYGLSAHSRATGNAESLAAARRVFSLIEDRYRREGKGYEEAFDLGWQPIANKLGRGGVGTRTTNTHTHLIEAYAGLLRAAADPTVAASLQDLLRLFVHRFLAEDGTHSHAYLDGDLHPLAGPISYGHDIEVSWLLLDAAEALADPNAVASLAPAAPTLARAAAAGGQCGDGGWIAQRSPEGQPDRYRDWWVQAEAVVGLVDAAMRTGDEGLMTRAEATWAFVERAVIDRDHGEWHERVDRQGSADPGRAKVGP